MIYILKIRDCEDITHTQQRKDAKKIRPRKSESSSVFRSNRYNPIMR